MLRFRISFDLVEDIEKQEKDFGLNENVKLLWKNDRQKVIDEHIKRLKDGIKNEFNFEGYVWVENLEIEEVKDGK